jgi:hypothetical protein
VHCHCHRRHRSCAAAQGVASELTLKKFALGGWKRATKLPGDAPFGWKGSAKGLLIHGSARAHRFYYRLLDAGVPR